MYLVFSMVGHRSFSGWFPKVQSLERSMILNTHYAEVAMTCTAAISHTQLALNGKGE